MSQDEHAIDVSILIDITNCFSELIMLTKTSSDGTSSVGLGFDRRAVLHAALKEGRIFMEQFIKTTKVFFQLALTHVTRVYINYLPASNRPSFIC